MNAILIELENARIIRKEFRLGGQFVEVSHEFLIDPILGFIADQRSSNANYTTLKRALDSLSDMREVNFRVGTSTYFTSDDLQSLAEHFEFLGFT